MIFCPNNAHLYGEHKVSPEREEEWCNRAYRAGSEQCDRCELRKRWGVGDPAPQAKKAAQVGPVQWSLF